MPHQPEPAQALWTIFFALLGPPRGPLAAYAAPPQVAPAIFDFFQRATPEAPCCLCLRILSLHQHGRQIILLHKAHFEAYLLPV